MAIRRELKRRSLVITALLGSLFLGWFYVYAPGRGVVAVVAFWVSVACVSIGVGTLMLVVLWLWVVAGSLHRAHHINDELSSAS
jgi:hypothetical protein